MVNVRHSTTQGGEKVGIVVAILAVEAVAENVDEDGLDAVALVARDEGGLIGSEAEQPLPLTLARDLRFVMVEVESFLDNDGGDMRLEAPGVTSEHGVAGKREVVGVAGVARAGSAGEAVEARIEAVNREVGERGRG